MMTDASRPSADRWVPLGEGRALLHYADGEWRFRHVCDRGERGTIICAPLLDKKDGFAIQSICHPDALGHIVAPARRPDTLVSVTPSIRCPDCGIHGWVTASVWRAA